MFIGKISEIVVNIGEIMWFFNYCIIMVYIWMYWIWYGIERYSKSWMVIISFYNFNIKIVLIGGVV